MGFINSIIHPRNLVPVQKNMASVLPFLIMSFHCLLLLSPFPLIASYSSQNFTQPLCHSHERSALLQFKESLVIDTSASQDPFAYPKVISWKLGGESRDCCSWDGVKCDEKTGHVIGLNLGSSFLYGFINSSSSLFRLRHLRRLDLADNDFNYSKIPSAIGNLSGLARLNLSFSGFYGQVPSELLWLSKLVSLDLRDNPLKLHNPGLRSVAEKLTNLHELHLSGVDISSQPKTKLDFPSLKVVDLSNNAFTGEFPFEYFESWAAMRSMDKDQLEYMHANSTIHVPHSTWFSNFSYSMVMANKGVKTNYRKILEFFTAVDLSSNKFEGGIPEVIGTLKELHLLNLSNNILTGHIPSSMGNMEQLEALDLSGNQLSGEIPVQLTQLTFLEVFNVSGNNLRGPIPRGKQFDTFERSSFEGNPGLCGDQLPKRCGNDAGAPPAPPNVDEEEGSGSAINFGWKIVAIGYACGMVFGGVIGYVFATKKQEWLMKTFRIKQQRKRRLEIRGHNNRT